MSGGADALAARVEQLVVEQWFADPPPMLRAMASQPTKAVARAFVLEWTKFSRLFPRWVGAIVSNCAEFEVIAFEVENLMTEVVRDPAAGENHYELLVRLGVGAGLDRITIESYQPCPEAEAAFAWWWQMARQPDWVLGFAAVNGLEILGDRNLPRKHGLSQGTGLAVDVWRSSGIDDHALEFFRVSDAADEHHGSDTVQILARHTPAAAERRMLEVLQESIGYLRRHWEGVGRVWQLEEERGERGTG
jgi:pyrroloquinoline quinone (PQQ) biosynthesis protein C